MKLNLPGTLVHDYKGQKYSLAGRIVAINESNDTATMKFKNGIVEANIPLDKIYLNEKLIDVLKARAKQVGRSISAALGWIYRKVKGFLMPVVDGEICDTVVTSGQIAQMYQEGNLPEGVQVFPSQSTIDAAAEAGVTLKAQKYADDGSDDDYDEINAFWSKVMKKYADSKVKTVKEAFDYVVSGNKLFEAGVDSLTMGDITNVINVYGGKRLQNILLRNITATLEGNHTNNLFIWGAPGIGKTQIVKGVVSLLKNEGLDFGYGFENDKGELIPYNLDVITLAGSTLNRDDFMLPMANQESGTFDDRVKSWLPAYIPTGDPERDKILDDMASSRANVRRGESYNGCVLFFDEFTRIPPATLQPILQLTQDRELQGAKLGSRVCIILAANRPHEMGRSWDDIEMARDAAAANRYQQVNFIPTREDWLDWARTSHRIHPDIISFIESMGDSVWYETYGISENELKNEDNLMSSIDSHENKFNTIYATPRTWDKVSSELYGQEKAYLAPIERVESIKGMYGSELSNWLTLNKKDADFDHMTDEEFIKLFKEFVFDQNITSEMKEFSPNAQKQRNLRMKRLRETEGKAIDPRGTLSDQEFLQEYLLNTTVPSIAGARAGKSLKEFYDYRKYFTAKRCEEVLENGVTSSKEENLYGSGKLLSSRDMKWKTHPNLIKKVFKTIMSNYPGGPDQIVADAGSTMSIDDDGNIGFRKFSAAEVAKIKKAWPSMKKHFTLSVDLGTETRTFEMLSGSCPSDKEIASGETHIAQLVMNPFAFRFANLCMYATRIAWQINSDGIAKDVINTVEEAQLLPIFKRVPEGRFIAKDFRGEGQSDYSILDPGYEFINNINFARYDVIHQ